MPPRPPAAKIIIVGPSGSGKSTVAQLVARQLDIPLIHMDDFRQSGRFICSLPDSTDVRSFENPGLWDADRIAIRCFNAVESNDAFVAEGNHLLVYDIIRRIPDTLRYYLDVPFEVSLKRRSDRARHSVSDESFARCGVAETARWVYPQINMPGVRRLDGTTDPAILAQGIVASALRMPLAVTPSRNRISAYSC